jgi:hypothetical protein
MSHRSFLMASCPEKLPGVLPFPSLRGCLPVMFVAALTNGTTVPNTPTHVLSFRPSTRRHYMQNEPCVAVI